MFKFILVRVVDGDTVQGHILFPWGPALYNRVVRLFGYDAPESAKHRPGVTPEELKRGAAAKQFLAELILKSYEHQLEYVPGNDFDPHGRVVGRLHLKTATGPIDVAKAMIENGHIR